MINLEAHKVGFQTGDYLPPVITIVFPLLVGIPQAPAPLSFKGNESPPEREMPL